ncbi:MAG TPA: hypothetical protein DEO38_02205 [Bacteroidales bacterium]|nr:hypothetical protein [Bacteroidales bacterium]
METKETNLFDLIKAFFVWLRSCFYGFLRILGGMLRLTYQHWIIVGGITLLFSCVSLYYSRPSHRTYAAKMLIQVNGTKTDEVTRIMEPLSALVLDRVNDKLSLNALLNTDDSTTRGLKRLEFCKSQLTDDIWSISQKVSDTLHTLVPSYIEVTAYTFNLNSLPDLQSSLLSFLNSNSTLVRNYESFERQHRFSHELYINQMQYIDSLSRHIYVESPSVIGTHLAGNTLLVGEQRKQTFENQLKEFSQLADFESQILSMCSAPAVVISDFAIPHKAVNGRLRSLLMFAVIGWLVGIVLAALYSKRREIIGYLGRTN